METQLSNILKNKMLSDESIDLAQQLLKKQFSIFGGLQDIALSEHYSLDVAKKDKPVIQVLSNDSAHWICVFNSDRNGIQSPASAPDYKKI